MESKHKHLEFLQAAISRMASNLFFLKGWSITIVAALFALAAKDAKGVYVILAYYPLLIFWALDGYFLAQERRFRSLYDKVRALPENEINFSMDTSPFKELKGNSWIEATFSRTLSIYYAGLALVMLVLVFTLHYFK